MTIENEYKLPADVAEMAARQGRYNMRVVNVVPGPEVIARLKELYADADPAEIVANANIKIVRPKPHGKR